MLGNLGGLIGQGRQAEIFAWGENQALKLFHCGISLEEIERELENSKEVQRVGLPVPHVDEIVELEGRHGIVFERVQGLTLLRRLTTRPWAIFSGAQTLASLHLEIHGARSSTLPSQREKLTRQINQTQNLSESKRQAVLDILDGLADDDVICHGDFHPDNVLLSDRGPLVIDWPGATTGNPLGDLARSSVLLTMGEAPDFMAGRLLINMFRHLFHRSYVQKYLKATGLPFESVEKWLVPITAARLSENIEGESKRLLAYLNVAIQKQS